MTLQQLESDYETWLRNVAEVLTVKGSLGEWLRVRLATAGAAERVQLRALCASRGKAAVYDKVREGCLWTSQ